MTDSAPIEPLYAADGDTWRAWLETHHASRAEVWLLQYKRHTNQRCVGFDEAVEEALCFGWVDSKVRRIDGEKHMIRFGPRKPGSVWAPSSKARVRRMIAAGRMAPAGLAMVAAAKKSGAWDATREP